MLKTVVSDAEQRAATKNTTMVEYARLACALRLLGLPRQRFVKLATQYRDDLTLAEDDLKELRAALEDCGDSIAEQREFLAAYKARHGVGNRRGDPSTPTNVRVREHLRQRALRLERLGRPAPPDYPEMTRAEAGKVVATYVMKISDAYAMLGAELAAGNLDPRIRRRMRRMRDRLELDLKFFGIRCT